MRRMVFEDHSSLRRRRRGAKPPAAFPPAWKLKSAARTVYGPGDKAESVEDCPCIRGVDVPPSSSLGAGELSDHRFSLAGGRRRIVVLRCGRGPAICSRTVVRRKASTCVTDQVHPAEAASFTITANGSRKAIVFVDADALAAASCSAHMNPPSSGMTRKGAPGY